MRLRLPSDGILGFKFVNMKQPTFKNLLDLKDCDDFTPSVKNAFLSSVITDRNVEDLTIYDRDYLFIVATSAVRVEGLKFTLNHCGKKFQWDFNIDEADVFEYKDFKKSEHNGGKSITVLGDLTLHVPLVKDETFAYNMTLDNFGEMNTVFFENALSLKCVDDDRLDFTDAETLEKTSLELFDDKKWIAILAWVKLCFHGIPEYLTATCPFCRKKFKFRSYFGKELVDMGSEQIMARYKMCMANSNITYSEFLNMTIPEFYALMNNGDEEK